MHQIFEKPFDTRWIFDVEILARYLLGINKNMEQIITEKIIEYPLESWTDTSGSKLRIKDFPLSSLYLAQIWFRYNKDIAQKRQKES